jgi:hypothetical protein
MVGAGLFFFLEFSRGGLIRVSVGGISLGV